ncbi:hypothetical protein RND81_01G195800 [Saponaria officinalis]|uniref:DUF4378 domain-containing protein n=1 Tax=Saponaria officinalis TaxID=3572 RepID=A0AAW1N8R7_SAPOF
MTMAKKSKKRPGRHEKDQAGCMWSLLNIFDSRPVRSSQKLILDRKRSSKRLDGAAYSNIKLESLGDSCRICRESNEILQNESLTTNSSKVSVKALMDEEMCGEQDKGEHGSIGSEVAKPTNGDDKGSVKKNGRSTRSKMSLDLETDGFTVAGDVVERPNHRKHKSLTSVDVNEMVEELCGQIQQKDVRNSKRIEDGELAVKSVGGSSVVENQLAEAAKVLLKHFADGNSGTKERKIQPSKEVMDALEILNANKELFVKLLRDPKSPLVKHIQSLQDIKVEDGKFKPLTESDLLEQDIVAAKQHNFFWRRFKGQERNSPQKKDTSVDLSTIVVLQPGAPESLMSSGDKDQPEKASSSFTFAELKRKFKLAMKKELLAEQPNLGNRDKKVGGEMASMGSPSRDHFFIEKIPNSAANFRKVDKSGKLKDGKIQLEQGGLTPEERVSNIYIEAKKHLAEIVGNKIVDVDNHGRKVPKSLGKILSYSGYSSPTICSPRIEADIRLSASAENTSLEMQDIDVKLPDQVKQESLISDKPVCENEVHVVESRISDELPRESDVDKPCHKSEVPSSEDIMSAIGAASQKESEFFEISVERCSLPEHVDLENSHSLSSEHNTSEGDEHSSYPDSATPNGSLSGKTEDVDSMSDATSRPSPVSVLEPVFREVDISPPGLKQFTAIEPVRPRQIKFEIEIPASLGRVPSIRDGVDYDKYTIQFVKDVLQMSGLTWDELLNRSLFSDHFINPSLIDEVDFLPDLLCCDFNLLFDLINEVVIELCWLRFSCMLSLAAPTVQLNLKEKDVFNEVWKVVNWYLKLDSPPLTLDQILGIDVERRGAWDDLRLDCENIGIQIQEAILDEMVDDIISSYISTSLNTEIPILP